MYRIKEQLNMYVAQNTALLLKCNSNRSVKAMSSTNGTTHWAAPHAAAGWSSTWLKQWTVAKRRSNQRVCTYYILAVPPPTCQSTASPSTDLIQSPYTLTFEGAAFCIRPSPHHPLQVQRTKSIGWASRTTYLWRCSVLSGPPSPQGSPHSSG